MGVITPMHGLNSVARNRLLFARFVFKQMPWALNWFPGQDLGIRFFSSHPNSIGFRLEILLVGGCGPTHLKKYARQIGSFRQFSGWKHNLKPPTFGGDAESWNVRSSITSTFRRHPRLNSGIVNSVSFLCTWKLRANHNFNGSNSHPTHLVKKNDSF